MNSCVKKNRKKSMRSTDCKIAFLLTLLVLALYGCELQQTGPVPNAVAHFALEKSPSDVSYIAITVAGPEMRTINSTFPAGTTVITMEVPAGENRTFVIGAYETGDQLIYSGSAAVDLAPGEIKSIEMHMTVAERLVHLLAVGRHGQAYWSADGTNWSSNVGPGAEELRAVTTGP